MPGGRPTKLDQVVLVRDDGTKVTTGEYVVERVRLGMDLASAADSTGIDRSTIHRWSVAGARHRAVRAQGKLPRPTAQQTRLIQFCNALESAQALAEADRLGIVDTAARGGGTVTKTTRKVQTVYDDNGEATERELERTVVVEQLAPQWTAAAWWLERKRGYVRPLSVELTGANGSPLIPQAEAARDLADSLREYLQGVEDGKTQATKADKA